MITYLGSNQPATPKEGQQHMSEYMSWLSFLGSTAVCPANSLKNTNTVSPNGSVTSGGQTLCLIFHHRQVLEVALKVAKNCPFLDVGGSLEVSELMQMKI